MTNAPQPPEVPPTQPPAPQPAKPDRTMAWLAHLLGIFTWFVGPLVIWLVKKDEDKYAAYHAKQALCFQVGVTIVETILGATLFLACFIPVIHLGAIAYAIVAIVKTSKGEPFKYILVADWFCKQEFAEAYPDIAAAQPPAGQ